MEFLAGSSPWNRPTRTEHNLFFYFFLDVFISALIGPYVNFFFFDLIWFELSNLFDRFSSILPCAKVQVSLWNIDTLEYVDVLPTVHVCLTFRGLNAWCYVLKNSCPFLKTFMFRYFVIIYIYVCKTEPHHAYNPRKVQQKLSS